MWSEGLIKMPEQMLLKSAVKFIEFTPDIAYLNNPSNFLLPPYYASETLILLIDFFKGNNSVSYPPAVICTIATKEYFDHSYQVQQDDLNRDSTWMPMIIWDHLMMS